MSPAAGAKHAQRCLAITVICKVFNILPRHSTRKQEFDSLPPRRLPPLPNTCFFAKWD